MSNEPTDELGQLDFARLVILLGIAYFTRAVHKLTIPGVVFHEFSHQLLVGVLGYRVHEVDYFSHVSHDLPKRLTHALLIAYAPLIINTSLAVGFLFVVFNGYPPLTDSIIPDPRLLFLSKVIVVYLAVSLLVHAVPSLEDIHNVVQLVKLRLKWYRIDLAVLFAPFVPLFIPTYIGLLVSRKTGTRILVDIGYLAFVLITFFGVVEWWVPVIGFSEWVAGEAFQMLVELFEETMSTG